MRRLTHYTYQNDWVYTSRGEDEFEAIEHTPKQVFDIPNNYRVYFSKNVAFNRATFREYARKKNLSIVRNIDKANIYVDKLETYNLKKRKKVTIKDVDYWVSEINTTDFSNNCIVKNCLTSLSEEYITHDIPMIDAIDLYQLCNETKILDYKAYLNIETFLSSNDETHFNMGAQMLVTSSGSEFFIANLWNKYYRNFKASNLLNSISFRTFMERHKDAFWISRFGTNTDLNLVNRFINNGKEVLISEELMKKYMDGIISTVVNSNYFDLKVSIELPEHELIKYEERQSINREEEQDQGEQLREGDYTDVEGDGDAQDQDIQVGFQTV